MLLTADEVQQLRAYLAEQAQAHEEAGELVWVCDHTLTHTHAWLEAHQKPVRENLRQLAAQGGNCDCEVLLNVSPARWPAPPEPAAAPHAKKAPTAPHS